MSVKRYYGWRSGMNAVPCNDVKFDEFIFAPDHDAEIAARDARIAELERDRDQLRSALESAESDVLAARRERDALQQRLGEANALLFDSGRKFNELYVTLATEDLSLRDLREMRTLADQGALAIEAALSPHPVEAGAPAHIGESVK